MNELLANYPLGAQLRGDVLIIEKIDSIIFIMKKKMTIRLGHSQERTTLKKLRFGISNLSALTPRLLKMVSVLHSQGFLKPCVRSATPSMDRQIEWLSHFSDRAMGLQQSIGKKKVFILGCGGTGCIIAEHLARAGVENFVLVDGATVDMPDMNRQLAYLPSDCGQKKVSVLAQRLKFLNEIIQISIHDLWISNSADLFEMIQKHDPDLVINAADTPIGWIHVWAAEACLKTNKPILFGGVGLAEGTVGPLLVNDSAKIHYIEEMRNAALSLHENPNILKASLAFTNSLIAVWTAFEGFKFLSGVLPSSVMDRALKLDLLNSPGSVQWPKSV